MNLGMGVMISYLGGNEDSVETFKAAIGKTIEALSLGDDALTVSFKDGSGIKFYDDGQSCCENRYFTCDDDLGSFAGSQLLGAEVVDTDGAAAEYGEHEITFLKIQTSNGPLTVSAHNEHNGYYGGFSIRVGRA